MAKKIPKKPRPRTSTSGPGPSPRMLFGLLLLPWIVMGIAAIVLSMLGLPEYVVILGSLMFALVVTFFVGTYVRNMRSRRKR